MNVIIVEDNKLDQEILKKLIQEDKDLSLSGVFSDAIEVITLMRTLDPDLIFLDIELPEMNGLEFLEAVNNIPQVIIITNHKEYALEAFEFEATDFLVKPVERRRFQKAIEKAKKIQEWVGLSNEDSESILVRVDRENVNIKLSSILYIEAMADYVKIHTTDDKHVILSTMKSIVSKLPNDDFVRIHRSFLINKNKLDSFKNSAAVVGGIELPVSRSGYKALRELV